MSGPLTRPLENENGVAPSSPLAIAADNSNVTQNNSVNDSLPYIWFNGVLGALALGLAIGAVVIAYIKADTVENKVDLIRDRTTISENHWRNIETAQGIMQSDIDKLEKANGDRPKR